MRVGPVSLEDRQVRDLLEAHQRGMHEASPPGTSFALDLTGLSSPDISIFGAWDGDTLLAVGALKQLSADQAEIKSMRTHPDHLRRGAAQAVLDHILEVARSRSLRGISLETGTNETFVPAVELYAKRGFKPGEGFAGYENGPHNQCYHLAL